MAERSMRRWLCVALAVVCLNSLWVPAAAQTDPNDVDAMARLQQAWGSGVTSWTGKDPCGGSWQGVICSGNRVISLYMVNRDLSGYIPSDIGGLSALQMLDLSFNSDLGGELPAELGSLTSLTYLSLQNCFFSGQIPPSLGNLVNLTFFRISNNLLTGTVPVFNALHQLEYVDFSNNTFDPYPFPSWLNASKSIIQTILILPNNQIDGLLTIPENLAKNLQYVDLQNNQIANISEYNPNATLPEMLLLDDNPMCMGGELPEAIQATCYTTIGSTTISWQSPVVNNTCPNVCEHNDLTLNPMRCQCSFPLIVIVSLQFLSPTFSGIDNDILWDVDFFNQTYNSLVNLTQNVGLTFEKDQLLVAYAFQASYMPKGSVYVTLNFFTLVGEIMAKPLEDTISGAFSSQQVTYASPFNIWHTIQIIPFQAYHIRKLSNVLIAVIVSISSIGVLLLSTIFGFLIRKLVRQTALLKEIQKEFSKNAVKPFLYSYNELKVATQDFHPNNKLGAGGYGVVYKGILIDGSNIAIKRLKIKTKQALQDFLNEIIVISSIKHRNLAQLKGCCIKGDERILIYELVENQNLAEALWDSPPIQHFKLDWKIRFNIIIGVARGLTYLHEDVQPSIIHRDIKPANILLDKDYNAKIADFGLALLFPDLEDDQTHQSITKIAGTRGYLAPEYAAFGQLSAKLDVFSYGILILEIISGRKNIDLNMPVEQQYLFDWAPRLYERGCLTEMIDATMLDSSTSKADIVKVLTVAIWCTQFTAAKRPSMSRVVDSLLSTKDLPDIVIAYNGNVEHDEGSEIDIELSLMQSIQEVEKETSSLISNTM